MPELDVKAERARVEAEINRLQAELNTLEARRQVLVNEIVKREGILIFLERLDGSGSPPKDRR
ncbi:MAG: hypothetical protein Q7R39_15335 [Dehalococcoidia bacterium]|nr:hypothetical protein [Dehalococcoidia bacterium]